MKMTKQHHLGFACHRCHSTLTPQLMENLSEVTEFLLVGLTDAPRRCRSPFNNFTLIYLTTLVGNLGMIVLVLLDTRPSMDFLLGNLSLVDCVYTSSVTPKVMAGILQEIRLYPYDACATQMFLLCSLCHCWKFSPGLDGLWRAARRPCANPATPPVARAVCAATSCYVCGLLQSSIHVALHFPPLLLPFQCGGRFFCDIPPRLRSLFALISTQMRLCSSHWQCATPSSLFWLSWAPTSSFLLLSWGCALLKGCSGFSTLRSPPHRCRRLLRDRHLRQPYSPAPATPGLQTKWRQVFYATCHMLNPRLSLRNKEGQECL